ncbi:MAG: Asp-tRNA(Asn)/Glu-tRNA(Gln) amidotransferase subunit GatC [Desulfovibrionaceae bacterium]|nr:Asp-tRNA(Asn)/Glu-tRNA(Gln) amidotransferase subunit GatC [Desulfovibrionaceae bacterium]MBF0513799.1 Asp-tRNA(Asn)/Glu-tRNA(Gln) amidotransferase subunit GatC [Desulfovibrionaceae bacterium]
MKITPERVAAVAKLARLTFTAEELTRFAAQIGDILAYMDMLNSLDTTGVEPLYSPAGLAGPTGATRPDQARQANSRSETLANAPATDGEFFLVPRVV